MNVEALRSTSRRPDLVQLRWAIATRLRLEGHTLTQIGQALNRHHTTILHALTHYTGEPYKGDDIATLTGSSQ